MEGRNIVSGLLTRILVIIIVLLIIGVAGGGAYLWHMDKLYKAEEQSEIDILKSKLDDCRSGKTTQTSAAQQDMQGDTSEVPDTPDETPQTSQKPQITQDPREEVSTVWVTEHNTKYGFQLQHPNTWKALQYKDHVDFLPLISNKVHVQVSIYEVETIAEARESIEELNIPDTALTSRREGVKIGEISWTKMSVGDQVFQMVEKDGKVFAVSYLKSDDLGKQIAESFQFTR